MGMRSASQAIRRTTAGVSSSPSSVTACPGGREIGAGGAEGGPVDLLPQHVQTGGDRDPGPGAVAVGWQVGGQGVPAGLDQRVPEPGAVVPRINGLLAVWVPRVDRGLGFGEREQGFRQENH